MPPAGPRVFISYSHVDEIWKDRLVRHLRVFELENQLCFWQDRQIAGGDDWLAEIERELEAADAAVLLITTDFLISDFIRGKEVPRLLERRARDGVRILPVIVKPYLWDEVGWLSALQCRPKDGRPRAPRQGARWSKPPATAVAPARSRGFRGNSRRAEAPGTAELQLGSGVIPRPRQATPRSGSVPI